MKPRDYIHIGSVVLMVVMLSLLVNRYYIQADSDNLFLSDNNLSVLEGDSQWYGIYFQDRKIGYSHSTISQQDSFYVSTDRTYMNVAMLGKQQEFDTYVRAVTDDKYQLRSFIFTLKGEDTDYGLRGRVDGKTLFVNIITAGEEHGQSIELDEPPQLPSTIGLLMSAKELNPGDKFSTTVFDPGSMSNQKTVIKVIGYEDIEYHGETKNLLHVHQDMGGMQVESYVDSEGNTLIEKSQMGYNVILEDELTARTGNWPKGKTDINQLVRVVPDGKITNSLKLIELTIELDGLKDAGKYDLDGGSQSYHEPTMTIISYPDRTFSDPDAIPKDTLDYYTSPTAFIQCEHPRLLTLAAEVTDLNAKPEDNIRAIIDWMQKNIRQKPTFSIPNTLEVLERKSGDCNEFAVLFCSFARAAGIPTRIALGLVYLEDAFYYHAWCESLVDGRWMPVDPVFGEYPANATHLRMITGDMDRQVEILPLVGSIGIKVVGSAMGNGSASE